MGPLEAERQGASEMVRENATEKAPQEEKPASQPPRLRRRFSKHGCCPMELVDWEKRPARIVGGDGEVVFERDSVEFPASWSLMASNVVASKYFRDSADGLEREESLRRLIGRVVSTIGRWAEQTEHLMGESRETFESELTHLLLHQAASFNSPVWFNCGIEERPQVSACFINSVRDDMSSILNLAHTEGMLFKYGSGAGTNLSPLRSRNEKLSGGGQASGPVEFMRGFDAFAGVIKSGGKTRRAAKMVILNDHHPDIMDFIRCKAHEERKAWALIDAGYDGSFNGEAYRSVFFQNANHSVRVSDEFMQAVEQDGEWQTQAVCSGEAVNAFRAREIFRALAESTHQCGDPGMQFDTTINKWNTCANSGHINASNPCSEFMFLDDSACNLSSLNLMRFMRQDNEFDPDSFMHAVEVMIRAQETLVGQAGYPTEEIGANSLHYRPLGLGYANLGALLMARGLPYDSDDGRDYAAAITALMTGQAYLTSAKMAAELGPFEGYEFNREPCLRVLQQHRAALAQIEPAHVPLELMSAARQVWDRAIAQAERHGLRNAQVTVLAPTGTIAFMMDCDTTGIEPEMALVKYKKLVGGGQFKIVNQMVPRALARLGYEPAKVESILARIKETGTIEGAPELLDKHLAVFDCAFTPLRGKRCIPPMGHLRMMAAVQPFLSGAISKTVNLPESATIEDIEQIYLTAWHLGLKSVALYRDKSKRTQPLRLESEKRAASKPPAPAPAAATPKPYRRRLPDERRSLTHKFSVGGHEGYITVGMYDDGKAGEIFIVMAKQGSVVNGLMDSFATAISMALQYGVPIDVLIRKFSHTRFEPSGFTTNREIPIAKSIMDYIFRWLGQRFGSSDDTMLTDESAEELPPSTEASEEARSVLSVLPSEDGNGAKPKKDGQDHAGRVFFLNQQDSPACPECGSITVRNGACHKCMNCGATTGCS